MLCVRLWSASGSAVKVLEYFGELLPCLVGIEACPSAHCRQLLARRGRQIPSHSDDVPPKRSVAVARAETFAHLSQFRDRTVATVEQNRRQAKRGLVEFPAFDSN
jgi:hypothetical protein